MFCGKCSNKLIMKTHYPCLRAIYNTQTKRTTTYFIYIVRSMSTHRTLISMTEIYKDLNKLSSPFIRGLL